MAKQTVAQEVLAYCGKCKMDLKAVIVAMKGDQIARVQCLTCKGERAFKGPKGVTEPDKIAKAEKKEAAKRSKKAAQAEAAAVAESNAIEAEWEKLMTAHRDAPMKAYSMKANFALGDKLSHPNFGDGIVGKLIYPNKLEVIFRTDVKVLIHGGAAA